LASQYTAVCITQDNELIGMLRAERVVYAAGNIEPVIANQFLFHDGSPIPGAHQDSTIRGGASYAIFPFLRRAAAPLGDQPTRQGRGPAHGSELL